MLSYNENDTPTVEAHGLAKSYEGRVALSNVDLTVGRGELVGLLGPNGAGKTTTLSILAGILKPDAGTVKIEGLSLDSAPLSARRRLGLVPQSIALYPTLSANENVRFFAAMLGLNAAQAEEATVRLLAAVGLSDRADDVVGTFSGGMKRRLNLACGMAHRPAVLLLDEPTTGVDPQSRERIFHVVEEASRTGTGVLYSTHYMEEAERICDRVILMDRGRVVAGGSPDELIALAGTEPRLEMTTRQPLPEGWTGEVPGVRQIATGQNHNRIRLALARLDQAREVLQRAESLGAEVLEFRVHRPNLQDAFMALTGHELRDAPQG